MMLNLVTSSSINNLPKTHLNKYPSRTLTSHQASIFMHLDPKPISKNLKISSFGQNPVQFNQFGTKPSFQIVKSRSGSQDTGPEPISKNLKICSFGPNPVQFKSFGAKPSFQIVKSGSGSQDTGPKPISKNLKISSFGPNPVQFNQFGAKPSFQIVKSRSGSQDTGPEPISKNLKISSFGPNPVQFNQFGAKPSFQIVKSGSGSQDTDLNPNGEPETVLETVPESESTGTNKTLQLGIVFGFWYFQNIVFNIYNKKCLNIFPYPWLLASFQLFVGSIWMLVLWGTKLQPCPKVDKSFIIALLGPALFHTIGHISACVSFSKVAVSFTHVIKSAEPVFSVVFSSALGDTYPLSVWLSILPIVMGCSLAAVTEVSFNLGGLWGAMISNVGFVLRNIYSKKSLQNFKQVNGLNLYGWITILSFFYLFPVAVFVEGSQWIPGYHKAIASVGTPSTFYIWVMVSGVFYHLYNQSSYQALDDISPLTFSVGNTMKRVVVIVSTVLVFRNPVRPLNALGSAIAILGTFLYSQASSKKKAVAEKKE